MVIKRAPIVSAIAVTGIIVLTIAGILFWREYRMLQKLQAALHQAEPLHNSVPKTKPVIQGELPLVSQIQRSADGTTVRARANFAAFKQRVENNPELLQQWGSVYWKILEDIPALCIRSLAEGSPFRALGARAGDCITHIDGETINQPMRNMTIWLTLPARSKIAIDTLRSGEKISYLILRQ